MSRDEYLPCAHEAHVHASDIEYASERHAPRRPPQLYVVTSRHYVLARSDAEAERRATERRARACVVESERVTSLSELPIDTLDEAVVYDGSVRVTLRTAACVAGFDGTQEGE